MPIIQYLIKGTKPASESISGTIKHLVNRFNVWSVNPVNLNDLIAPLIPFQVVSLRLEMLLIII